MYYLLKWSLKIILVVIVFVIISTTFILFATFIYEYLRYGFTYSSNTRCTKNCTKVVNLGKEFRMIRGEVATLKDTSLTLSVESFDIRPKTTWGGSVVNYTISADGISNSNTLKTKESCAGDKLYITRLIESDYISTAVFVIRLSDDTICEQYTTD